jgi:hypothetical protein
MWNVRNRVTDNAHDLLASLDTYLDFMSMLGYLDIVEGSGKA